MKYIVYFIWISVFTVITISSINAACTNTGTSNYCCKNELSLAEDKVIVAQYDTTHQDVEDTGQVEANDIYQSARIRYDYRAEFNPIKYRPSLNDEAIAILRGVARKIITRDPTLGRWPERQPGMDLCICALEYTYKRNPNSIDIPLMEALYFHDKYYAASRSSMAKLNNNISRCKNKSRLEDYYFARAFTEYMNIRANIQGQPIPPKPEPIKPIKAQTGFFAWLDNFLDPGKQEQQQQEQQKDYQQKLDNYNRFQNAYKLILDNCEQAINIASELNKRDVEAELMRQQILEIYKP